MPSDTARCGRHECAPRQPLPGSGGGTFRRQRSRAGQPMCADAERSEARHPEKSRWRRLPNELSYRFRFTSSCNISSLVVITLLLAWKPRCVTIMLVNSCARSTFDISSAPLVIVDCDPSSA